MDVTPTGLGSNSGMVDLALLLDPEAIRIDIAQRYGHLASRRDDLIAGFGRFNLRTEHGIDTDEMQGKAADFVRQLTIATKDIDAARGAYKAPVLGAQRAIDTMFSRDLIDPLAAAKRAVESKMTDYAKMKATQEQRRREAEARRQAEEAAKAAEAAQQQGSEAAMAAAVEAEQAAMDAADRVVVKPAELSRTRSDLGSTSSLRARRTWELDDLLPLVQAVAAGKAPLNLLTVNKVIADAMAKDKGQRDLPGLQFVDDVKIRVA